MNWETFRTNLLQKGYQVSYFDTAAQASAYLDGQIDSKTVGLGDSKTLADLGLYGLLCKHNQVFDPTHPLNGRTFNQMARETFFADVFLLSVNAASETGELVNIDSTGNRVAASLFGHDKVYFVFSACKVMPTLDEAIWRARNVAAPINAKRFGFQTPCAVRGDRCYDCNSPDRICNAMMVHHHKVKSMDMEVVVIGESLGY